MQLGKRTRSSTPPDRTSEPTPLTSPGGDRRVEQTTKITPLYGRGGANRPTSENELREDLSGMAASLTEVDPRAAERLQDLADAIGSEAGRLRWADVDLRRAFNTDHLSHAYAVRREGGFAPASIDIAAPRWCGTSDGISAESGTYPASVAP